MTTYLVRHAKAGDRERWTRPDEERPLTKPGWKQAAGLVDLLDGCPIRRILSSPYLRCTQTVDPLAKARSLELESSDALAEGAALDEALPLLKEADAVLCTHGDVLDAILWHLRELGVPGIDPSLGKKGSTWIFEGENGDIHSARYLEPPA